MTTTLFIVTLLVVSTVLYISFALTLTDVFNSKTDGALCATIITIIFMIVYCKLTPSIEQMIENNYYAMLNDRPECIDYDFSLGCKKEYIEWQKDSIEKQRKFDSVKAVLDNKQKELLK